VTGLRAIAAAAAVALAASRYLPAAAPTPTPRRVDVAAADGFVLEATLFAAAAPGPGAILLHQSNRNRDSWEVVAARLAGAGVHTLTVDLRGHGETGGAYDEDRAKARQARLGDLDAAFAFLASRPGVDRGAIGLGGAGAEGVDGAVRLAMRHAGAVRSLALLSGETFADGLQFLKEASRLPAIYVFSDDDEYPPTVEAMELTYVTHGTPMKRLVHYAAEREAPWLWYEPVDVGRVPASGGHGTDLFAGHAELPGILVEWFVTTLVRTPGRAPVETLASAATLEEIRAPGGGGVARVRQRLLEARKTDPQAQLFPEITASIIGFDYQRAGDARSAVEVLELVQLAYPTAAAHENLSEALLQDGRKDVAREEARTALAMLDAHAAPASSWSDTDQFRGELRRGAKDVIEKAGK
jgi:dienelactone hydrolase